MPLQEQVIAQNMAASVVVLSSDPKGTEFVEWQPAGDAAGGDVQVIPDSIASSVAFTRLIQRGVVQIIQADESYMAAIDKQRAAFEARMSGAANKASDAIVPETKNDLLATPCIGPDPRGTGPCGVGVPMTAAQAADRPPLCPTHANLSNQYIRYEETVPVDQQSATQGPTRVKWSRTSMTAREVQNA